MKKSIFKILICTIICACGFASCGDDDDTEVVTAPIETIIKDDISYMNSKVKNPIFWETRLVLSKPFNESDELNTDEVTNVFQTNVEVGTDINTTVYMVIHDMKTGRRIIEVHKDAWIADDKELNIDSIHITFDEAFKLARQSNFAPSTSKYITLRHGLGRYECNPFYSIGNESTGHLWVDAITGDVMDKDPATIEK